MIKLVLALILLFIIAAAGYFLQRYDFPVTAQMQGYLVETSSARLVIIFLFLTIILFAFAKIIFWFRNSPRRMLARLRRDNERQGYRNIMRGFSSLAAGDGERAQKLALKAQKSLPEEPLVKLLLAQIKINAGRHDKAAAHYRELTLNEDGKFAGFRGLVSQSMQANQPEKALAIADELLRDNPKSSWLNEALIDLAFRINDWDKLERYLKKAEANRALDKTILHEKFAIYYYMKGKIAYAEGRLKDAQWLGERALKYKVSFLPAAILLTSIYNDENDYKSTTSVIAKIWALAPHPALAKNYEFALLNSGIREKAAKVRKLYDKNPDDLDSIEFYAKTLLDERNDSAAREVLLHGVKIRETRNICLLMARVDDKIAWESRALAAFEDKCWNCRITGARYAEWQPYSDSGELNTIVWSLPQHMPKSALAHNDILFIS